MIDALNITLSGPTGSGKSLIGGIIAKVLHERGADVEVLLDGCPSADSGIDLSGFAVVMRDAPAPSAATFEVTGRPVAEMSAEIRSRIIAMGIEPRRVMGLFVDPTTGLLSLSHLNGKKWPMHRSETAEDYAAWKAAESKAKPVADPMPPVGPLTSTVNLKPGDIVRVVGSAIAGRKGDTLAVTSVSDCGEYVRTTRPYNGDAFGCLAFVARPGTWMPYTGSENPAPELDVRVKEDSGIEFTPGEQMQWDNTKRCRNRQVAAFMVVPDMQRTEASNVFFPGKTLNGSDVGPLPAPEAPSTRTIAPSDVRDGDQIRVSVSAKAGTTGDGAIDRNFAQRLIERIGAEHVTVELISRPLAVGDTVTSPNIYEIGTIRHIAHGVAAVEFAGDLKAIAAADLTRAPAA